MSGGEDGREWTRAHDNKETKASKIFLTKLKLTIKSNRIVRLTCAMWTYCFNNKTSFLLFYLHFGSVPSTMTQRIATTWPSSFFDTPR